MSIYLANGSIVQIASTMSAAVTTTAVTNASEAVATATNTYANGDIVAVTSGWNRLNERVVRVKAVSGTTFTMEGIDTTSTTRFPAGSGTGTSRKVSTWVEIGNIINLSQDGGAPEYWEGKFLADDYKRKLPTGKSALGYKIEAADDTVMPAWVPLVQSANDDMAPRAFRIITPSAGTYLCNGIFSFNSVPALNSDNIAVLTIDISVVSLPVRYYT